MKTEEEINTFLETYNLLRLNHKQTGNRSRPTTTNIIIKTLIKNIRTQQTRVLEKIASQIK